MSDSEGFIRVPREPQTPEQKQSQLMQRRVEAEAAMRDYRAQEQALRDRTAKLREERRAREKIDMRKTSSSSRASRK